MDFSSLEHTRNVWEQIEPILHDRQKPEGLRFLGNNNFSSNSVESLLTALADNLAKLGAVSIDRLNNRWGDRQDRNWVKIITFVLSEYAYYNESEGSFWESLFVRLGISDTQGTRQAFYKILKEGFALLGGVKAGGGYKYLSTLYLQSGIPQQSLPHFAELLKYVANNLGWWNIAYRYNEIDLAQTLYDLALEKHSERGTLNRFLRISCPSDNPNQKDVEPLSGNLLKYIATVALELERRQQNPSILGNEQKREQYLQGLRLPYNFFLRNWDNLASVLTPRQVTSTRANQLIRQRKREIILRLDTLELNLQLVLPEQSLWRKEWRNLSNSFCRIPQTKWEFNINYPNSVEIPELCVNLHTLSDRWTWQLKDANNCDLIEWHCEGVTDNFPLLIFDAETGDRVTLNTEPQITGVNELVCYFPVSANLQIENDIEVTDPCFACLIQGWQAKQIRLNGRSATFTMIDKNININISVKWQAARNRQPIMRGLQIKGKKPIYLEVPLIYYPLGDSADSLRIQIEDMERQEPITPPDQQILVRLTGDAWQKIELNQWIENTGNYEVRLWQGNWLWVAAFTIESHCQIPQKTDTQRVQIQNSKHHEISTILPIRCHSKSDFWTEQITIQGIWSFEPVIFVLSGSEEQQKYNYSTQADQTGCLNLSLMSLREVLPDSDRYSLEWIRLGNAQKLISVE